VTGRPRAGRPVALSHSYARAEISSFSGQGTSGNLAGSIGLAAVAVVIAVTFLKWPISARTYSIVLILATILAFILYNPASVS
jgi:cobalamin biosynthesis protein CobD/CbiB